MNELNAQNERYPRVRVAVIIIDDGKIVLVRHEKYGKTYWVLPGGGVDFGESLEEAAVREVKEEINLDIAVDKLVFVNDSLPEDLHRHVVNVYFTGRILGGELKLGPDSIMREVRYFPVEELANLLFYPGIAEYIVQEHRGGFRNSAQYLGNIWK